MNNNCGYIKIGFILAEMGISSNDWIFDDSAFGDMKYAPIVKEGEPYKIVYCLPKDYLSYANSIINERSGKKRILDELDENCFHGNLDRMFLNYTPDIALTTDKKFLSVRVLWRTERLDKDIEKPKKKNILYAICELLPSPIGDVIHIICFRDRKEDAEIVLGALNKTNYDYLVYRIFEYPIGEKGN